MSSWLEGDDEGVSTATPSPPAVQDLARTWPLLAVLALSFTGLVVSLLRSPTVSTVMYATLMGVGCGLLFFRRYDAIGKTRSAGGAAVLSVQAVEKVAIAALTLACLANGIVIAYDVAAWSFWTRF